MNNYIPSVGRYALTEFNIIHIGVNFMRDSEFSTISKVEDFEQVFFNLVYSTDELTLLLDI